MDAHSKSNTNMQCNLKCIHGQCEQTSDENFSCRCEDGYGGDLCDTISETCRDGSYCLNDSKCIERIDGKYYCDCSQANLGSAVYAGLKCEYAADIFCEFGVSRSEVAFCANRGICNKILVPGNEILSTE